MRVKLEIEAVSNVKYSDPSRLPVHSNALAECWHIACQYYNLMQWLFQVKSAWAGYYDYNYFDENLIIGNHPVHRNFFFATGCSGHGIQQALAIGRGLSELILKQDYETIDLKRFQFDRIMDNAPVFETNCVWLTYNCEQCQVINKYWCSVTQWFTFQMKYSVKTHLRC